ARYMLQEDDGTLILLTNKGYLWGRNPDTMQRLREMAFAGGPAVEPAEYYLRRRRPSRSRAAATTGSCVTSLSVSASARPTAISSATTQCCKGRSYAAINSVAPWRQRRGLQECAARICGCRRRTVGAGLGRGPAFLS